eukprot:751841-Hanusia_phi.AAC.1
MCTGNTSEARLFQVYSLTSPECALPLTVHLALVPESGALRAAAPIHHSCDSCHHPRPSRALTVDRMGRAPESPVQSFLVVLRSLSLLTVARPPSRRASTRIIGYPIQFITKSGAGNSGTIGEVLSYSNCLTVNLTAPAPRAAAAGSHRPVTESQAQLETGHPAILVNR